MAKSQHQISEIEKTNLEAHVNMSFQRYLTLEDNMATLSTQLHDLTVEIRNQVTAIHTLQSQYTTDITSIKLELAELQQSNLQMHNNAKLHYSSELSVMRDEFFSQTRDTTKVIVGAAATIAAGLLSTIIVLLVTLL